LAFDSKTTGGNHKGFFQPFHSFSLINQSENVIGIPAASGVLSRNGRHSGKQTPAGRFEFSGSALTP
jgi:hypothetical protein